MDLDNRNSCNSVRDALVERLAQDIFVSEINDQCVLTLPFRTIDDRYPDVFVERKLGGSFLVHDAGRTTSSLYAQGIHMTEGRIAAFGHIGATLGVGYSDGTFQVLCSDSDLQAAILAVAECILFGTMELLAQKPVFDEEPVKPPQQERTR